MSDHTDLSPEERETLERFARTPEHDRGRAIFARAILALEAESARHRGWLETLDDRVLGEIDPRFPERTERRLAALEKAAETGALSSAGPGAGLPNVGFPDHDPTDDIARVSAELKERFGIAPLLRSTPAPQDVEYSNEVVELERLVASLETHNANLRQACRDRGEARDDAEAEVERLRVERTEKHSALSEAQARIRELEGDEYYRYKTERVGGWHAVTELAEGLGYKPSQTSHWPTYRDEVLTFIRSRCAPQEPASERYTVDQITRALYDAQSRWETPGSVRDLHGLMIEELRGSTVASSEPVDQPDERLRRAIADRLGMWPAIALTASPEYFADLVWKRCQEAEALGRMVGEERASAAPSEPSDPEEIKRKMLERMRTPKPDDGSYMTNSEWNDADAPPDVPAPAPSDAGPQERERLATWLDVGIREGWWSVHTSDDRECFREIASLLRAPQQKPEGMSTEAAKRMVQASGTFMGAFAWDLIAVQTGDEK